MRALLFVAALLLVAPAVLAQTPASPISGTYSEVYVVMGRALDQAGLPVSGGTVIVELDQSGVKAEPLYAAANCKGDFITSFNLRQVDPRGKVKITLLGPDGLANDSTTVPLDPFYRRSDGIVRLQGAWDNVCSQETNVWPVSASVSVRLLNRTAPYPEGAAEAEQFHALPYTGIVRMRYETPDGNTVCPPHPQDQTPGSCELFLADDRGDLRYTFTLDQPFPAGGRVELLLQEGATVEVPIDPATRIGFGKFEMTGQGVPAGIYDTPSVGVVGVLGLLAVVGLLARRR